MKKLLKWILPMVIVAAAIPVFPSLKAEVEPVKVEAKKYDETIVLNEDKTLTEPIVLDSGKNILLDFNGHKVKEDFSEDKSAVLIIKNNTKVTIEDSHGVGLATSTEDKIKSALIIVDEAELNIRGGGFKCDNKPVVNLNANEIGSKSNFVLSEGTLKTVNASVIINNNKFGKISVKVDGGSIESEKNDALSLNRTPLGGSIELKVNNGDISGGNNGIVVDKEVNVKINGGKIKGIFNKGVVSEKSIVVVNGGSISVRNDDVLRIIEY